MTTWMLRYIAGLLFRVQFFCIFFWRTKVCWPLLCLCRPFCSFERCLDSNQESCRCNQARYQLSHPSPYYATNLLTQPPISLLSHPSPYLATHLPTQSPISLLSLPSPYLSHPSHKLATHSLLSHLSPYLATPLPIQPPISLEDSFHEVNFNLTTHFFQICDELSLPPLPTMVTARKQMEEFYFSFKSFLLQALKGLGHVIEFKWLKKISSSNK